MNDKDGYPSPAYAWYVVGVLVVAYSFSFVDRSILTLLVGPIRASLKISDVQVSLLHGLAFAVFYTFLGIPIGRWADRGNRTHIISAGILMWSATTAMCGLARNFLQMFLARIGVGVGEAALSPTAYSLLADYFPSQHLTRALSVYTAAIYVGSGVALITGGAVLASVAPLDLPLIGHLDPWQVVFLWVGLPGIPVVLLMATVREPARHGVKPQSGLRLRDTVAFLRENSAIYAPLLTGYGVRGMIWQGVSAWIPTFFMRSFHWSPAAVGLRWGLVVMVVGTAGIITGGWLGDRMRAKGIVDANVMVCILALIATCPFGIIAPLVNNAGVSLAVYAGFTFFASFPNGAVAASLQEITPNQMRAQVSALYLFGNNMFGIGLGATVVALFTDHLFASDDALRYSMAMTVALITPLTLALLWPARAPFRRAVAASVSVSAIRT